MPAEPRPVAAVVTEWHRNSHADVILGRLLEPEAFGHERPFGLKLAAIYFDQVPPNDIGAALCKKHGVPIFETITGAVGVGTKGVPVEGVLIVGEHGRYAENLRGQTLYPRRRLFEGVVHAFRLLGRRVPVFTDKHLSYDWLSARWMIDLARHEGIPLLAGSSLPLAWRVPELELPRGVALEGAFALGYHHPDHYGFHALETLQCMVERRRGGETGVERVRCVAGKAAWDAAITRHDLASGLETLRTARRLVDPAARIPTPSERDLAFLVRYADGLEACVGMVQSVGECFGFACRRQGASKPEATVFALENDRPFGHFGYLVRAIESLVATGQAPYPVDRTLLTTGMLEALLQSRREGGTTIPTPHLAALRYEPADWPHATGPVGKPA